MNVSSDTKTLYITLNDLDKRILFNRIIRKYPNTDHVRYRYFFHDKRNGVYLWHLPKFPTLKFTTMLTFHGYSNDSPFLRELFELLPLFKWSVKRLDIAFDFDLPYHQFHVIHPAKRAKVKHLNGSVYVGSKRSCSQIHMYDKQAQMKTRRGKITPTWTRIELRLRLKHMKSVSKLTQKDFLPAEYYQIITDVPAMPVKLQGLVQQLNRGKAKWSELTRANQKKIREYGLSQGLNLYCQLLSNLRDMETFIYSPTSDQRSVTL